jgi:hypothetical protein
MVDTDAFVPDIERCKPFLIYNGMLRCGWILDDSRFQTRNNGFYHEGIDRVRSSGSNSYILRHMPYRILYLSYRPRLLRPTVSPWSHSRTIMASQSAAAMHLDEVTGEMVSKT